MLVLCIVAAGYAVIFFILHRRARKQIRESFPVGSEYSIAMGEESMRLTDAFVTIDLSYRLYRSIRCSAHAVALLPRQGRRPTVLPVELFTPESLAWLKSRLTGPN